MKICSALHAIVTRMKHSPCPHIHTVVSPENLLSYNKSLAYAIYIRPQQIKQISINKNLVMKDYNTERWHTLLLCTWPSHWWLNGLATYESLAWSLAISMSHAIDIHTHIFMTTHLKQINLSPITIEYVHHSHYSSTCYVSFMISSLQYTHTHTTILPLYGFSVGQRGWAGIRRNIHPLTPIVVINRSLSASSI